MTQAVEVRGFNRFIIRGKIKKQKLDYFTKNLSPSVFEQLFEKNLKVINL